MCVCRCALCVRRAGPEGRFTIGPEESSRGKKLIGFGKLFGLQDIYECDEELVRGGTERDESGGSTNETERKWRDQVDGLGNKRKKLAKKAVHFGGRVLYPRSATRWRKRRSRR